MHQPRSELIHLPSSPDTWFSVLPVLGFGAECAIRQPGALPAGLSGLALFSSWPVVLILHTGLMLSKVP